MDGDGVYDLNLVNGPVDDGGVVGKAVVTGNADPDKNFKADFSLGVGVGGQPEIGSFGVREYLSNVRFYIQATVFLAFEQFF